MDKVIFNKGMVLFLSAFPGLKIKAQDQKAWKILLDDLPGEMFMAAITKICRDHAEFFPGTNFVALVRRHAMGTAEIEGEKQKKIIICPFCNHSGVVDRDNYNIQCSKCGQARYKRMADGSYKERFPGPGSNQKENKLIGWATNAKREA